MPRVIFGHFGCLGGARHGTHEHFVEMIGLVLANNPGCATIHDAGVNRGAGVSVDLASLQHDSTLVWLRRSGQFAWLLGMPLHGPSLDVNNDVGVPVDLAIVQQIAVFI